MKELVARPRIVSCIVAVTFVTASCSAHWVPLTNYDVAPVDVDPEYLEGSEVQFQMADRSVFELFVVDVEENLVVGVRVAERDTVRIDLRDVAVVSVASNTATVKNAWLLYIMLGLILLIRIAWENADWG